RPDRADLGGADHRVVACRRARRHRRAGPVDRARPHGGAAVNTAPWQGWAALVALAAALALPVEAGDAGYLLMLGPETILIVLLIGFAVFAALRPEPSSIGDFALLVGSLAGGGLTLSLLSTV